MLGGEGNPSEALPVTPITEPLASSAPTLVTKGQDSITVEWLAPTHDGGSPITKYILYVRAEHDSSYQQVYSGIALSFRLQTKYFPAVLRAGFSYSFKVRSVNAAGPSPLSAASELMLAASVPSAPRNITLVSRSSTSLTI